MKSQAGMTSVSTEKRDGRAVTFEEMVIPKFSRRAFGLRVFFEKSDVVIDLCYINMVDNLLQYINV